MKQKWYSNILKVLFLAIFYGYVGVSIFYSHIHIINGDLISHVHFFERTAEEEEEPFHSHTQAEIELLNSLTSHNTARDIIPHFVFFTSSKLIVRNEIVFTCKGFVTSLQADFSRRGPPNCYPIYNPRWCV